MDNFEKGELNSLKDDLLIELFKDAEMPHNFDLEDKQKDYFLRALIVLHSGEAAHEKLLLLQNKFLEIYNKNLQKNVNNLNFNHNFCETNENILNFNVDLLVFASENKLEDGAALESNLPSLDNDILFRAGVELKSEMIFKLKESQPIYFLNGFALNANKIAKILIDQNFDETALTSAINAIFDYAQNNEVTSMAMDFSAFKKLQNCEKFLKIAKN